ncbi:MAG: hypothetical protein ACYS0H_24410, partial [Planctomycetota bacterium]
MSLVDWRYVMHIRGIGSLCALEIIFLTALATLLQTGIQPSAAGAETRLPRIRLSEDGTQFV